MIFFPVVQPPQPLPVREYLHFSSKEAEKIRARLKSGPYKSKGDARPNSPGDGDLIYRYADELVNDPLSDYYTGPTQNEDGSIISSTNPVKKWATPGPDRNGRRIGTKLLCAAYLGAVTGETKYINAAKACILNQVNIAKYPNLDFSNTGMWKPTEIGDINPGFEIAEFLGSELVSHDFVKSHFSDSERQTIEKWHRNAASFFKALLSNQNNSYFVDRRNGNYTFTNHNPNENDFIDYTHDNGYSIKRFTLHWNNRLLSIACYLVNAGVFFNDESLIEVGLRYTAEVIVYAMYANGMTSDFERASGDDKERGVGYFGGEVANLCNMVSVLVRSGRFDIVDFATNSGAYGTESPTTKKTVKLALDALASIYCKDQGWKYQGEILDGNLASKNWYSILDTLMAPGNMYFQDEKIRKVFYRIQEGCNEYPSSPAGNGPVEATFGNGNYFAGVCINYFHDTYEDLQVIRRESWKYPGKPLIRQWDNYYLQAG